MQAGWATQENTVAKREWTATLVYYQIANTAAKRERTARLGYDQIVSRRKRLKPLYSSVIFSSAFPQIRIGTNSRELPLVTITFYISNFTSCSNISLKNAAARRVRHSLLLFSRIHEPTRIRKRLTQEHELDRPSTSSSHLLLPPPQASAEM